MYFTFESPSAANVVSYANIIRERSLMRELIEVGNDIAGSALRPEGRSGKELVDEAERSIYRIAERGAQGREPQPAVVDGTPRPPESGRLQACRVSLRGVTGGRESK